MYGREPDAPFYRPDLSKGLWVDSDTTLDSGWLLADDLAVSLLTDTSVTAIDTDTHTLTLSDASQVTYGQLLLATGSEPRTIDMPASERIIHFRTVEDYRELRRATGPSSTAIVMGGGYIGSEIAASLSLNDVDVTLVVSGGRVLEQMFPATILDIIEEDFAAYGVRIVTDSPVASGSVEGETVSVRTESGETFSADVVVAGLGVVPNDQVAQLAGIDVDNGIVVDEHLATSAPDVWAAGDVADYPDVLLGRRRVEHVDNAEHQGALAGANMAAAAAGDDPQKYSYTPIYWSDIYDHGYEAVGTLSSTLDMVEDFTEDKSAGIVYYVKDSHVEGVLLWNVWDSTDLAKEVISQSATQPLSREELIGRIPLG